MKTRNQEKKFDEKSFRAAIPWGGRLVMSSKSSAGE
jgi:hypothetical protein